MKTQSIENQEGIYQNLEQLTGKNKNNEKSLIRSISELIDSKFNNNLLKSSSKKNQKLNDEIELEVNDLVRKEEINRIIKNKKEVQDILQHTKLNLLSIEDKEDIELLRSIINPGGLIEKINTALLIGDSNPFSHMLFNMHIERIISDLKYKIEKLHS